MFGSLLLCQFLVGSWGKYKPTNYVVNMHGIPPVVHFSSSPSYFSSLVVIPLIIFLVSVLVLVFFLLYVFSRYVKGKCCPHTKIPFLKSLSEISSAYLEPDFEKRKYHYRHSIRAFFLFLFAGFCANTLVYVGSSQMTESLQSTSDGFNLAAVIFFGLGYYANELDIGLNNITAIASSFPCKDALAYAQKDAQFETYCKDSSSFASLADNAANFLGKLSQNAATTTETVGIHDKDVVIGVYFVSITCVFVFFIAAYVSRSKGVFTIMILVSAVFVFLLCILHSIILFALVSLVLCLSYLFLLNFILCHYIFRLCFLFM